VSAKVNSCAIIEVAVDCNRGLSSFMLVNWPDTEVKEITECVRSAIRNSGLNCPHRRIIAYGITAPVQPYN
jgi:predicted ATPase with chaperone activity